MSKIKLEVPITIQVSMGATVNIGNYESRKVSIGISYPVEDSKNIKPSIEKLKAFVKKQLDKEVEKIREEFGGSVEDIEEVLELEE